eukprot:1500876-Amphidinium_carterae.2
MGATLLVLWSVLGLGLATEKGAFGKTVEWIGCQLTTGVGSATLSIPERKRKELLTLCEEMLSSPQRVVGVVPTNPLGIPAIGFCGRCCAGVSPEFHPSPIGLLSPPPRGGRVSLGGSCSTHRAHPPLPTPRREICLDSRLSSPCFTTGNLGISWRCIAMVDAPRQPVGGERKPGSAKS